MTRIQVAGAQLSVRVEGPAEAPVLMILHGGLGDSSDLAPLAAELTGFRLVFLDSRGHGRSTLGDLALDYPRLAADAEAVIDSLGVVEPVVIGHSDGGITALHLAARGRVRLRAIVPLAANVAPPDMAIRARMQAMRPEVWAQRFPEGTARYQAENPVPDFPQLFAAVQQMWCDTTPGNYPGAEALARITCPALVLAGDADHLVPRDETLALAAALPGAALGLIPLAGHMFPTSHAAWTAGMIRAFLEKHPV